MPFRPAVAAFAALVATGAPPALAQASPAATPPASASAAASASLRYRSAFEGYRAYADAPVQPWHESNDQVARIGGWKAYLREAQGQASPAAGASAPAGGAQGRPPGAHPHHGQQQPAPGHRHQP